MLFFLLFIFLILIGPFGVHWGTCGWDDFWCSSDTVVVFDVVWVSMLLFVILWFICLDEVQPRRRRRDFEIPKQTDAKTEYISWTYTL